MDSEYLVRNPTARLLLKALDAVLPSHHDPRPIAPPKKILLANLAHLGDVVISTAALRAVREAYPEVTIGFLAGSWSRPILEGHPAVTTIHDVDHWKLSRRPISLREKFFLYRAMARNVIRELREVHYDVAIDLFPYFPNAIPLLHRANIPVRIGYPSGGFGKLLTHPFPWKDRGEAVAAEQMRLLSPLGIHGASLLPHLPYSPIDLPSDLPKSRFLLFHMGPPTSPKAWGLTKWRELADEMLRRGYDVVFTGSTDEEFRTAAQMGLRIHNACGRLTWRQWAWLIQCADAIVTIDSAAGHIASAYRKKVVVLFTGIDQIDRWKPVHPESAALIERVPCAPCHRKRGCSAMTCVRGISVEAVLANL
jgi:ADP-heptose:LPS heptosyltransferase